jgi:Domain of unknown function (DUF4234)
MRVEPFRRGQGSGSGPRSRALSAALFLGIALAFLLPFATVSCDQEDRTTFTGLELATRNVPETPTDVEGESLSSMIEDSGANAATFVLLCVAAGLLLVGLGRRGGGWFAFGALAGLAWLGREATGARPFITVHTGYWLALGCALAAAGWYATLVLDLRSSRPLVQRPWVTFLVSLLTFGLYQVYWHYAVNRDLDDYGRRLGASSGLRVRPWLSVLAFTLGALLIVPLLVTIWRTFRRIQRAGVLAGVERPLEPWLGLVLLLGAIVWIVPIVVLYEQSHVNDVWKHAGAEKEATAAPAPAPLPA